MIAILNNIKIYLLFFIFFIGCGNTPKGNWKDQRVILISIDGFRGSLLKEKLFAKKCPNLLELINKGRSCSQVVSVFPSLTYPAHTSMITGVPPEIHGITNNRIFDPSKNFVDWFWYADSIKTPTLITKAKEKNLVSLGVSWPVTVGAAIDYLLPEFKSVNDSISTVDLIRKHDNPKYFLEIAKTRGIIPENKNPEGFSRDLLLHQLFIDTFIRKKPNLSLYHMIETDLIQHKYGKDSEEAWKAFMFMDSLIGNIMSLLDKNNLWETTTLVITGDHGFKNYSYEISINRLFENKGWLKIKNDEIYNWEVVAIPSGGSAFVHLKDSEDEQFKQKVRIALSQMNEFEVLEERHVKGSSLSLHKSNFILLAKKDYTFTRSVDQPLIKQRFGGSHGGDPEDKELYTGFIAVGPSISNEVVSKMAITDVAKIISPILGLNLDFNH